MGRAEASLARLWGLVRLTFAEGNTLSSSVLHLVFTHGFVRDSSSARCVNVRAAAHASASLTLNQRVPGSSPGAPTT